MTDPRTMQRQLIAAKERADELEHQLTKIAELCAPLLVHHSMVRHYDEALANHDGRLADHAERIVFLERGAGA